MRKSLIGERLGGGGEVIERQGEMRDAGAFFRRIGVYVSVRERNENGVVRWGMGRGERDSLSINTLASCQTP